MSFESNVDNLEIRNADKITFVGPSTSTVVDTVNGRVGIGTNAPSHTLEVSGDINLIQSSNVASLKVDSNTAIQVERTSPILKFPRTLATNSATWSDGSGGTYVASHSTEYNATLTSLGAFTGGTWSGNYGSHITGSGKYISDNIDISTGKYSGSESLSSSSDTPLGEWIKIQLSEFVKPVYFTIRPRAEDVNNDQGRQSCVRFGSIWGSNDDTNWVRVGNIYDFVPESIHSLYTSKSLTTNYYQYFAVIIERTNSDGSNTAVTFGSIGEFEIYGTPQTAAVVDGMAVTLHSVPNTPSTDFLDVYIDGNDYTSMPSGSQSILDKSGNERHGTPSNVTFDAEWKAFNLTSSTTSTITLPLQNTSTTNPSHIHSIALWLKMDDATKGSGGGYTIFVIGTASQQDSIILSINMTEGESGIKYDFYDSDIRTMDAKVPTQELFTQRWAHIVLTYEGDNNNIRNVKKIYLNGHMVSKWIFGGGVSSGNLTLPSNANIVLGAQTNSGSPPFSGSIANFRMYNRVISEDEIWQLYSYQKEYFGHEPDTLTFKNGRLGIGTDEPTAVLDVRGSVDISHGPVRGIPFIYDSGMWHGGYTTYDFTLDIDNYAVHEIYIRYSGIHTAVSNRMNVQMRGSIDGISYLTSGYESWTSAIREGANTSLYNVANTTDGPRIAYYVDTSSYAANNGNVNTKITVWNNIHGRPQFWHETGYTEGNVGFTRSMGGGHNNQSSSWRKIRLYFTAATGAISGSFGSYFIVGYPVVK